MTLLAIINKSTLVSDADVTSMTQACQYQMTQHCAALSGRAPWTLQAFKATDTVPDQAIQMLLVDDPDQAGVLGYHTEDATGKASGFVFARPVLTAPNGSPLVGSMSVSSVVSHEALETYCDKTCALWVDRMDGTFVALEVGDPVENDSYTVSVGSGQVSVSNFVLYDWFDPQAPTGPNARFDFLHHVTAPLTMSPGGYTIVLDTKTGVVSQVFGSRQALEMHKVKKPASSLRRTARRGALDIIVLGE